MFSCNKSRLKYDLNGKLVVRCTKKYLQVLSQYNDKLDEINKLKERALEKEHLLKDSEIKVSNLQNQINEVVKMSEEKQSSDDITTNGYRTYVYCQYSFLFSA